MSNPNLIKAWEKARVDLGLEVVTPFEVKIDSRTKITSEILVKNFGGRNGTLIVTDYAKVKPHLSQLRELHYGFSVMDEPNDSEPYSREDFIEMLSEWGWTGEEANQPKWMQQCQ